MLRASADTSGTLKSLDKILNDLEKGTQERLEHAGVFLEGKMGEKIDGWIKPANHPFTVEQKESSQPLMDDGELRDQIDHRMNGRYAVEVGVFGSRAKIAKVHEFGKTIEVTDKMRNYLHWKGLHLNPKTTTIKIPERSFMRSAHQENLRQIKKIVRGK